MADTTSGIEAMRERMARASRKPPPTRRAPETTATPGPEPAAPPPAEPARGRPPAPPRAGTVRRRSTAPSVMHLAPDVPPVNLAIRVRRPLDDRLADLIHTLRGRGVRTSKVELIEMLLWELPEPVGGADDVMERLGRFRTSAPRSITSAIPGGAAH